jgi:hypothetical protein
MEKIIRNLESATNLIKTSDHLVYLTFPLLQDKRILLKAVLRIKESVNFCINSILKYEYLKSNIKLYKDPKKNFKIFKDFCAEKYQITNQEIKEIIELFELSSYQEKSVVDFMKNQRVILLSESMEKKEISLEKAKSFLHLAKNILKKTYENLEISIKTQKHS